MKTKTLCCLSFLPSSFFQNLLELIDAFVNPFDFFWLYLLWHQKLLYLVAPFTGKQVLKRRSSNGSAVGPPGQSMYIICSPLMLQHIKVSSVIASLNWLFSSRLLASLLFKSFLTNDQAILSSISLLQYFFNSDKSFSSSSMNRFRYLYRFYLLAVEIYLMLW